MEFKIGEEVIYIGKNDKSFAVRAKVEKGTIDLLDDDGTCRVRYANGESYFAYPSNLKSVNLARKLEALME